MTVLQESENPQQPTDLTDSKAEAIRISLQGLYRLYFSGALIYRNFVQGTLHEGITNLLALDNPRQSYVNRVMKDILTQEKGLLIVLEDLDPDDANLNYRTHLVGSSYYLRQPYASVIKYPPFEELQRGVSTEVRLTPPSPVLNHKLSLGIMVNGETPHLTTPNFTLIFSTEGRPIQLLMETRGDLYDDPRKPPKTHPFFLRQGLFN